MSTRALQIGAVIIGVLAIGLAIMYVIAVQGDFPFNPGETTTVGASLDETPVATLPQDGSPEQPLVASEETAGEIADASSNNLQDSISITIQPPSDSEVLATPTQPGAVNPTIPRQASLPASQRPDGPSAPAVISAQGIAEEVSQSDRGDTTSVVEASLPVGNGNPLQRSGDSPIEQEQATTATPDGADSPTPETVATSPADRPDFRATLDALTGEEAVTPVATTTPELTSPISPTLPLTTPAGITAPQSTETPDEVDGTDGVDAASIPATVVTSTAEATVAVDSGEDRAEGREQDGGDEQTPEPNGDVQQDAEEPDVSSPDRPDFRATLDAVTGNIVATPTPIAGTQPDGQAKGGDAAAPTQSADVGSVPGAATTGQPDTVTESGQVSGQLVASETASLYLAPSFDTEVVGTVEVGQPLPIVARLTTGEWYLLTNGSWINASSITQNPGALPLVVPTHTPTPTPTPTQTTTPLPTPTDELPPTPTPTPTSLDEPICACESDQYDCLGSSFKVQADAQACFEYCFRETGRDVHNLDPNENGQACENLD